MNTYFATAERSSGKELALDISACSHNPVIDSLLKTIGGLLAVLNEHRQIVAVNDDLLEMLGIKEQKEVLGLRPGEAVKCIHAFEMSAGCGTSKHCSSCGAATAIVATLGLNKPEERYCAISVNNNGKAEDIFLRVRSCPIAFDGHRFVLLFLQDWTAQQQRSALERTFFHDFSNIVSGLDVAVELLDADNKLDKHDLVEDIKSFSKRLSTEIRIQRSLFQKDSGPYQPELTDLTAEQVVEEVKKIFSHHPAAKGKTLSLPDTPSLTFKTDFSMLLRIIVNMVLNAFEATDSGAEVKFWIEAQQDTIVFLVWNKEAIPEEIMGRMFQRNFSTKAKNGRGIGTFSMKMLGEQFLGGKVDCTTSEAEGTVFRFCLPYSRPAGQAAAESLPTGEKHILLVDDDEMLIKVVQKMLMSMGYTVTVFCNAPEAFEAFQSSPHRFDLVITDQLMPQIKGIDLAAKMMEIRPDVPVILYSGFSDEMTPQRALAAGIKAMGYKPITRKELELLINKALS